MEVFSYSNIVAGLLVLIIGFIFHFIGQFISIINWDKAVKLGLAEKDMLPEYTDYEYGIGMADVIIGWLYIVIGFGLILDQSWSFKLAWIPGVIFIYHSFSFYFWSQKQEQRGYQYRGAAEKIVWFLVNLLSGIFVLIAIW